MSSHRTCIALVAAAMATLVPQRVEAQAPPILPSTRVLQVGPASLYPVAAVRNVGTDSNVYNDGLAPREDFTYAITPKLYVLLPIGGTRFVGQATGDFI